MSSNSDNELTPNREVNSTIILLLEKSKEVLGDNLLAMYLHGSLATGDFNEKSSDIDFIVVLDKEPSDETIQKLRDMHSSIIASNYKWAGKLEGSYVQKDLFTNDTPPEKTRPYINGDGFYLSAYGYEWVIEKYVIREKSIIVFGPQPAVYLDKITLDDILKANRILLLEDWQPMISESTRLEDDEYLVYAILTMCRCLYLFEHGEMASKPVAAKWVQKKFVKWKELVETVSHRTNESVFCHQNEIKDFIKFTIEFTKPSHCK